MAKKTTLTIVTTNAGVRNILARWMENDCGADLGIGKGGDGHRVVRIEYDKLSGETVRPLLLAAKGEIIEIR